jgi:uncharacterized protein
MFYRDIQPTVTKTLEHFPCVALTGVRQCGKTTFLGTLGAEWQRFDMENSNDRMQVLADPDQFFRLHPNKVIIDEAQLAPEVFSALRVAIDRDRSAKGRFVLSGSSSPQLVTQISETLSGRVARLEMSPLTLTEAWAVPASKIYERLAHGSTIDELIEALKPQLSESNLQEYWFEGGYPEPWSNPNPDFRALWHRNYIDSYLLRDIAAIFPNLNRDRFRQFISVLSQASGTILNNADFARTLGVSEPTIRDWLSIAHDTYLWRHIPAWDRSAAKQLVKHPKGFLRDSGLLHKLLRILDQEMLATHPVRGRSWEAMVTETILRGFENAGKEVNPFHFRTRGGAEIDLILEGQFGRANLLPIEIKLTNSADKRALKALNAFIEMHDCPFGLVISNDEKVRRLDSKILAIPATCL